MAMDYIRDWTKHMHHWLTQFKGLLKVVIYNEFKADVKSGVLWLYL